MNERVTQWLLTGRTGMSSKAIVAVMEGATMERASGSYPLDPDDLGRCIALLDLVPEYRERLHEMGKISPVWAQLVTHWDEIERLYHEEAPTGRAPKCYDRMKELIDAGRKEL